MPQAPKPLPVTPDQVKNLALETIRHAKFPLLATVEGDQPRLRPISPLEMDGFQLVFASMKSSGKTLELEQNSKVEICWFDSEHHQVRLTGVAAKVNDPDQIRAYWERSPLLKLYLDRPDHPELMIYVVRAHRVRYMREWALAYHEVPLDA